MCRFLHRLEFLWGLIIQPFIENFKEITAYIPVILISGTYYGLTLKLDKIPLWMQDFEVSFYVAFTIAWGVVFAMSLVPYQVDWDRDLINRCSPSNSFADIKQIIVPTRLDMLELITDEGAVVSEIQAGLRAYPDSFIRVTTFKMRTSFRMGLVLINPPVVYALLSRDYLAIASIIYALVLSAMGILNLDRHACDVFQRKFMLARLL